MSNNCSAQENQGNYHALLIGVASYSSLAKEKQLIAPENDVLLLKETLLDYHFDEKNITTLTTSQTNDLQPTRRIIFEHFEKLIAKTKANDKILLYFSGHGSQQENTKESDGLDELFLPADIGIWEKDKPIKNAIIDNEIGSVIRRLLDKKASIWLIMDSCHSATGARGEENNNSSRKSRGVSLHDLGAPEKVVQQLETLKKHKQKTQSRSEQQKEETKAKDNISPFFASAVSAEVQKNSKNLFAFYATSQHEKAFESKHIAFDDNNKKIFYGDFTYALIKTLREGLKQKKYRLPT